MHTPLSHPLLYQGNAPEIHQFHNGNVTYTSACVFHFSSLVSVGPQKCSFVWHTLKDVLAHSPTLLSGHLNSILVSLFLAEHAHHPVLLPATDRCLLCLVSSLVISLVGGACASCLLTWVWGTLTISYSRSHTTIRLNSWCDNCESVEGRMKKLLGMANSRGWENSFIVHFQDCWLMEKRSSCDKLSA
jgi:hypothetical protein